MPNECWQSDFTHYPLADGTDTEILTWLDDHSRYALSLTAHHRVTGPAVLLAFRAACEQHGIPASTLTDNGMVFTTRLAGGRGGRNALEHELRRLGIKQKNGKPNHPQTQGKVERFQQTMKNWLRAQPAPARHPRRAPGPARRLRRASTTPGARTAHCPAARPPPPPTPPGPRPSPATAPPTPTTASAPTASTPPASSPSATTAAPPHRHRPRPRRNPRPAPGPGPAHPRHQRRHRRAHPRTYPQPRQATTSPPASHQAGQRKHRDPYVGSRCPRCLATSHVWQVLGSNQRRLSRRFYRPLPLATRATCLAPPHRRQQREI